MSAPLSLPAAKPQPYRGPHFIPHGVSIAYPPDPLKGRILDERMAKWLDRPSFNYHTKYVGFLGRSKAAAELMLIAGGELSLDPYLRAALLAEAHRHQRMLFEVGIKLCRRFEVDKAIREEPVLGGAADA